ncbi:MAG: Polyphosphate kinase [Bacteroidetes bacterium]|nr:MAG: Polyphosphate kinase [Bacteroidota bacterium]
MNPKKIPLVNREISWLSFNDRVLQEAEDVSVPLLERLRFLGIYSNNRDEFFRVRVATLKRIAKGGKKAREIVGEEPGVLLERIQKHVIASSKRFDKIYNNLIRELGREQIYIVNEKQINREQGEFVRQYFRDKVLPSLFPIMLDQVTDFPYLKDRSVYFAIKLGRRKKEKKSRFSLIEIPTDVVSRFLVLPAKGKKQYVILVDDVIRYCLGEIFPQHEYDTIEAHAIKMTRDAELDMDNDVSKSFVEKVTGSLKKRKKGIPVRFVYDQAIPDDLLRYLLKQLRVISTENIIPGSRYHNFKDFINFPALGRNELRYKIPHPLAHPRFRQGESIFDVIRESDVLLHFPYHSFHHIIDLLREASIDPRVLSISITLYRVARNSNIVNALINAIKNGKKVTVIMELQARFDEENNIYWANRLQEEGATVIFGVPHLKVHSKLFLITRKEEGKAIHYAHIGTGNLNENTATIYTDKTLLTADKRITAEVAQIFDFYNDNLRHGHYKHLLVSPFTMRKKFVQLINNEIGHAQAGRQASIFIKINNLVDRDMIAKLYEASKAGVKIRIIVRGTCALVPGVPGFSENIEAISIVDKFLEHARVFIFHNGGDEKYFISSADWMTRNLDYRSETATPIYDAESRMEMRQILELQWKDNRKARIINRKQDNQYKQNNLSPVRAQDVIHAFLDKQAQALKRRRRRIRKPGEIRRN